MLAAVSPFSRTLRPPMTVAAPVLARPSLRTSTLPGGSDDHERRHALFARSEYGALPWETEAAEQVRHVRRRRAARRRPGAVQRSVRYQSVEGAPKRVDQLFETSCAAVEAMAAWDRKPGNTYETEKKRLAETGCCTLPTGASLVLSEETRAEIEACLPHGASPETVEAAFMQAAMMQKADPSWRIDSPEGLDAQGVEQTAAWMGAGLFLPGAFDDASALERRAGFQSQLLEHGSVQVVIDQGDSQHAVTAKSAGEGRYALYEGNMPVLDAEGRPLQPTWDELEQAMAEGPENVGAGRIRVAAAFGRGEV